MQKEINRIYFSDNPYPNGHQIIKFIWQGRIEEDETMWFDFHLESDNYYAEDDSEDSDETIIDWKSKIVWSNYHACKLSSIFWEEEQKGILIKNSGEKLDFAKCIQKELTANQLPLDDDFDYEDLAFNIYLLGHDSCADHKIIFTKKEKTYNIEWTGKIALTYGGNYNFDHEFVVNIANVKFEGFHYPKSWTLEKATEVFKRNLDNFEDYKFVDLNPKSNKREYKLMISEE